MGGRGRRKQDPKGRRTTFISLFCTYSARLPTPVPVIDEKGFSKIII